MVSDDFTKVTFTCHLNLYSFNSLILREYLELLCNYDAMPKESDIRSMLEHVNYVIPFANLGEIVRKNLCKELSYFFDAIIKVVSGKISNFDAIITSMQQVAYNILFYRYFDCSNILLIELVVKLGQKDNDSNHIYYAKFIMIIINHFAKEIEVDRKEDTFDCWV